MESQNNSKRLPEPLPAVGSAASREPNADELPVADMFGSAEDEGLTAPRRDFLKMLGFSVTAATLAASCETPVRKAIPYVIKPEEVMPGMATWYATTFLNGSDWCPILVKTREGRPIKIEGNPHASLTQGGVESKALASVLDLYSNYRLRSPQAKRGESHTAISWADADTALKGKLEAKPASRIAIVTQTVLSPSTKAAVSRFRETYPNTVHVAYDAMSQHGLLEANAANFGRRAMPAYRFDKSDVVVGFSCDYLGAWGAPVQNQKSWAKRRKVSPENPDMLRMYQFESWMSRTGSNADYRIPLSEADVALALLHLHDRVASKAGASQIGGLPALSSADAAEKLDKAASDLWKHRGKGIVCAGINHRGAQLVANRINTLLGNYGKTLQWDRASLLFQGNDDHMAELVADMAAGRVDMLIIQGANPVYDYPGFATAMAEVATKVSTAGTLNETASLCDFVLPEHHNLESWNDAEAASGMFSLVQPTIRPLFDTRAFQQTLLSWAGEERSWYDFMAAYWDANILSSAMNRAAAWTEALQKGVYESASSNSMENLAGEDGAFNSMVSVADAAASVKKAYANRSGSIDVVLYEDPLIGTGDYTGNPWLQETPDPITKISWDQYAMVNPGWAREQGLSDGDHVQITTQHGKITVPVAPTAGTARGTMAVAVGYGRTKTGNEETNVGGSAYALQSKERNNWLGADWTKASGKTDFARSQDYDSLFDDSKKKRPHVKETTLAEYQKDAMAGNHDREEVLAHLQSFYPDRFANKNGFHWGLAVDLNSCIGCGVCHVACQSENNIPVVGKAEMARKHEMHWMRIDRYFAGSEDNPEVVFQPMMCQHCDQAPCENVCPVAATNHSSEGLNQMAYNRCIGTRYCANNCPYKVRRFNWFDYMGADSFGDFNDKDPMAANGEKGMLSELTRMVLNPDVTVRSRGVMEKCSFCVQRIQEGKLQAKLDRRPLEDGDIKTACQTACTTGAITFGNLFDNQSEVFQLSENNKRAFRVIEEFHTLPSVTYLTKVRNKDAADHVHDVPYEGTLESA